MAPLGQLSRRRGEFLIEEGERPAGGQSAARISPCEKCVAPAGRYYEHLGARTNQLDPQRGQRTLNWPHYARAHVSRRCLGLSTTWADRRRQRPRIKFNATRSPTDLLRAIGWVFPWDTLPAPIQSQSTDYARFAEVDACFNSAGSQNRRV